MSRIAWWTCYSQLYESSEFVFLLKYILEVTYNNNNSYADEDSFVVEFTQIYPFIGWANVSLSVLQRSSFDKEYDT